MSAVSIRVSGLSKQYHLDHSVGSRSFRELLHDIATRPLTSLRGRLTGDRAPEPRTVWALRNLCFEVGHGETVGIVGRNGSGKSTLLKILSQITKPTLGRADMYGTVGSLLEVEAGFHGELTGRENVYLSGAILGMRRREIDAKFDEIVAFAEIAEFLDTPVKHYSSGMGVRLGFAVAAHLEPDILLVDEVLAVGDVGFRKKCLDKMQRVATEGRTILFVSHDLPMVARLCPRALVLDAGRLVADGPSAQVIRQYVRQAREATPERTWEEASAAPVGHVARLRGVRIGSAELHAAAAVANHQRLRLEVDYEVLFPGRMVTPYFDLCDANGTHLFRSFAPHQTITPAPTPEGRYVSVAWIPAHLLCAGIYFVSIGCDAFSPQEEQFYVSDVVSCDVVDQQGDGPLGLHGLAGIIQPHLEWSTNRLGDADETLV